MIKDGATIGFKLGVTSDIVHQTIFDLVLYHMTHTLGEDMNIKLDKEYTSPQKNGLNLGSSA